MAPADLVPAVIGVFIDILPNWGLFDMIKQICHASVGILMECLALGKTILPLGDIPSGYPHWHRKYLYNVLDKASIIETTNNGYNEEYNVGKPSFLYETISPETHLTNHNILVNISVITSI